MRKGLIVVFVFLFCLIECLSGCTEDENNSDFDRLLGTWKTNNDLTLILRSDYTCSFMHNAGDWELKDGKIYITINYQDGKNMMAYDLSLIHI